MCERVARAKSSKRSRSTTVRPARFARRMRPVTRSTSASRVSVDLAGRPRAPPERPLRPDRPPAPARPDTPSVVVVRERVQVPARGAAEHRDERLLRELRDLTDRPDPAVVQARRGLRPDAPQPLDRKRVEEPELPLGRDDEQPVGLRDAARDLGEELRPRDADRDRETDALAHVPTQPRRDLGRRSRRSAACPRTSRNASSIESPSTSGVASSNTANIALLASV